MKNGKVTVAFLTGSSGDWGGASRVLFTALRLMDLSRIEPVLLLPGDGPIVPELKARGLRHLIWGPLTEPGKPWQYLRAIWRTIHFLRREQIDVLHVNHSNIWRPAEFLGAKLAGVPIVTHYHTVNDEPGPFVRMTTVAVAVSHYVAQHSRPEALEKVVIYNPVDLNRFGKARDIRSQLGLSPQNVVVSFMGQIRAIKGVMDFIEMAKHIPDQHARFLIAGECRDPAKFEGAYSEQDLAAAIGGDTRIRYVGYLSNIEDLYRASDIVVMPSRWQEPLGLINLEAGATRLPVVATRVGGIPEIIRDGENGYLVEPGDVAGMAECVARLVADAELRSRIGSRGRAVVESQFTDHPVRQLEALFERLAHGAENPENKNG